MGLGHEGRAPFVPGQHQLDVIGIVHAVEGGQIALTRDGKDPAHALFAQTIDQNSAAMFRHISSPVTVPVRSRAALGIKPCG